MPSLGDLLYAFTDWLRTTPVVEFSLWLSNTPVSLWIQTHFWAIPIIQTLHILTIALTFGSILMINLRVLGVVGAGHSMTSTSKRYLPWVWFGLVVLILTGIGMVIGEPVRELVNPVFWVKMGFVIFAILLSLWFEAMVRRTRGDWDVTPDGRAVVRVGAVAIILLWCLIMVCGRWIAYAPV